MDPRGGLTPLQSTEEGIKRHACGLLRKKLFLPVKIKKENETTAPQRGGGEGRRISLKGGVGRVHIKAGFLNRSEKWKGTEKKKNLKSLNKGRKKQKDKTAAEGSERLRTGDEKAPSPKRTRPPSRGEEVPKKGPDWTQAEEGWATKALVKILTEI